MKIEELKTLTNKVLDTNKNCHVDLDVWYPTVEDIKGLLKLGHDKINPNSNQKDVTIFNIEFDDYGSSKSPAFRITVFCHDFEAEFMRKYYESETLKKEGGDKNC